MWARLVGVILLALLAPLPASAAGPWRAQVVDADTGAPLEGVAILATWHRRARGHPAIGIGRTGFHSAEEAATGADGVFVIPARLLVDAPPLFPIEGPALALFHAGYGGWRFREGRQALTGDGAVIEMRPLGTAAERVKYLERRWSADERRSLMAWRQGEGPEAPTDAPWQSLPRYEAAINAARGAVGLRPVGIGYPGLWTERAPTPDPPGEVRLRGASGVAVDARGNVYVADTDNHRIVKLNAALQPIATWGGFGRREGELQFPRGVAVDGDVVYVSDWGNHRVQTFSTAGRFLAAWGELRYGELGGTFSPTALAMTRAGEVVAHTSGRIYRFTRQGALIASWGRPFQFASRAQVAVDAEGHVYGISGASGDRPPIMKLDREGKELATWGRNGHGRGELFDPIALALDGAGRIYVACWGDQHARVIVFDAAGAVLHQWDVATGTLPVRRPNALAIDAQGAVYVVDIAHPRVHRLAPFGR